MDFDALETCGALFDALLLGFQLLGISVTALNISKVVVEHSGNLLFACFAPDNNFLLRFVKPQHQSCRRFFDE